MRNKCPSLNPFRNRAYAKTIYPMRPEIFAHCMTRDYVWVLNHPNDRRKNYVLF